MLLAVTIASGTLYWLIRGDAIENSLVSGNIRASIQRLVGPGYAVELGPIKTALRPDWRVSVSSDSVRIRSKADGGEIARLDRIVARINPLSILRGAPQIDAMTVAETSFDARSLKFTGESPLEVSDVVVGLAGILGGVDRNADASQLRRFRIDRIRIDGLGAGRINPSPIEITELEFRFEKDLSSKLAGRIELGRSLIKLSSSYVPVDDQRGRFELSASGIKLGEWLRTPEEETGFVGSDAMVSLAASANTDASGAILDDPKLRLDFERSTLRVGWKEKTKLAHFSLNFRLIPNKNQIELDPSILAFDGLNTRLIGGVTPLDPKAGFAGPLKFELIADPIATRATQVGERLAQGAARVLGIFEPAERIVDLSEIVFLSDGDEVRGSAIIGFSGETPSVAAAAQSAGIDIAAVKQFWPFFLAAPARDWADNALVGGRATNIAMRARLPGGVLGRLRHGAKMTPDTFELTADFSGARIDTFGELPAMRNASGKFRISGMTVHAELGSADVFAGQGQAKLKSGSFEIEDFAVRPLAAYIDVAGDGPANVVGAVAAAKPLRVAERVGFVPDQLEGLASLSVQATLPLKRRIKGEEVDWAAKIGLKGVGSATALFGRKISNADLSIDVVPGLAKVNGQARLDGIPARLELLERFGDEASKPTRKITLILDEKTRTRLGMSLSPVVDGVLKIDVSQSEAKPERYVADLSEADLKLPWLGWRKGKGIAAKATFRLATENGVTKLDDIFVDGPGFSAAGSLVFGKGGLISADFADVSLNQGDTISVKISRSGNDYKINAEGARFDARGLINQLLHVGGFADAQGSGNIEVNAVVRAVTGFGDTQLRDVAMSYGTRDGWFDNLSLRGSFSDTSYISLIASTDNRRTTFSVDSTDGGATLRMADIYRRMYGGRLHARLVREGGGAFSGPVRISEFVVRDEPRLRQLISDPVIATNDRDAPRINLREHLNKVKTDTVRFAEAVGEIQKDSGSFRVRDGILRSTTMGMTVEGLVYDGDNRMDIRGTFLPGIGLNRAIGLIPVVGGLLGDGRETGLIGITFRLFGPSGNPVVEVNPMSLVTPGVFRKVFEFR